MNTDLTSPKYCNFFLPVLTGSVARLIRPAAGHYRVFYQAIKRLHYSIKSSVFWDNQLRLESIPWILQLGVLINDVAWEVTATWWRYKKNNETKIIKKRRYTNINNKDDNTWTELVIVNKSITLSLNHQKKAPNISPSITPVWWR